MYCLQVVCEVVLLADVDVEAVGHLVEVVLADAADEAVVLQLVLDTLHLVSQGAERVNDETWLQLKNDLISRNVASFSGKRKLLPKRQSPIQKRLLTFWS